MLRKCLSAVLCGLLALSLAACGEGEPASPAGSLSSVGSVVSDASQASIEAPVSAGEVGGESSGTGEEASSQTPGAEPSTPASGSDSTVTSIAPPVAQTSSQRVEPVASPASSTPSTAASPVPSVTVPPASSEPPSSQPASSDPESTIHVSMTIAGLEGEVLYAVDDYEVAEGSTVFTVLRDFAEQNGIEYAYSGGTRSAYVTGIAGLHEFDHGKGSGWLYRVNGDFQPASVSCGSYPVYDDDRIEWLYTLDLGATEGATF